jgi:uncharacterized protein YcbK (DUF882 family)
MSDGRRQAAGLTPAGGALAAGRRRLLGCACCAAGSLLVPRVGQATGAPAAAPGSIDNWRARLLQGERSLWLVRGEDQIRSTYWTPDAGYDGEAYKEICWLLRDVQANKSFAMSPRLLDVLCGLQNWLAFNGHRQPIHVNSGYRTFSTNYRAEGSALNSRHLNGQAADITVPGVALARLAGMASLFGEGGVGMYLNKGFVHVDTGNERIWIK